VAPDLRVLGFSALVILLTGVLFGLAPAIRSTRVDLLSMMKQTTAAGVGKGAKFGSGKTMVALQSALSILLLIGAGLFIRTVTNLRTTALGYQPDGLLYVRVEPRTGGVPQDQRGQFFQDTIQHLERTRGVTHATGAIYPLLLGYSGVGTGADMRPVCTADFNPDDPKLRNVNFNPIAPHYFETMKLPLIAGRDFEWSDTPKPGHPVQPLVIVNDAFAKKYYKPGKNPIGEKLGFNCPANPSVFTVIGVAADSKSLPRQNAVPMIYLPLTASADALTVILRTSGDPARMAPTIRRAMTEFDSRVPLFGEVTPTGLRDLQIKQERLLTTLLILFGSFAMLLCSLGIYGLLSYTVSRRTSEIGLHMALGAQRGDVIRMIVGESLVPVSIGLVGGVAAAFGLTRFVASMLFGISKPDVLTTILSGLVFLVIAAIAAAMPAQRASRIDPLIALRYD
jgi:predicted permease